MYSHFLHLSHFLNTYFFLLFFLILNKFCNTKIVTDLLLHFIFGSFQLIFAECTNCLSIPFFFFGVKEKCFFFFGKSVHILFLLYWALTEKILMNPIHLDLYTNGHNQQNIMGWACVSPLVWFRNNGLGLRGPDPLLLCRALKFKRRITEDSNLRFFGFEI